MTGEALRSRLHKRAQILELTREFFRTREVTEVSTPALSVAATTDPALHSLSCDVGALGGRHYLHTSPEFAMKRLLAAGSGDIWQLARVFRDGEIGRWHQPEFLLLEWYRIGFNEKTLMDEVFALLQMLAGASDRKLSRLDTSYGQAFSDAFGIDPHKLDQAGRQLLVGALQSANTDVPTGLTDDGLLDLALSAAIVPSWPPETAIFLYDYPATQAALAAIKPGNPQVAARFEVFINGLELGNGFRELTDAEEQRQRFAAELAQRESLGLEPAPVDHEFLAALESGLPDCAGVAVGIDRLMAFLNGDDTLAAAIEWPHQKLTQD